MKRKRKSEAERDRKRKVKETEKYTKTEKRTAGKNGERWRSRPTCVNSVHSVIDYCIRSSNSSEPSLVSNGVKEGCVVAPTLLQLPFFYHADRLFGGY